MVLLRHTPAGLVRDCREPLVQLSAIFHYGLPRSSASPSQLFAWVSQMFGWFRRCSVGCGETTAQSLPSLFFCARYVLFKNDRYLTRWENATLLRKSWWKTRSTTERTLSRATAGCRCLKRTAKPLVTWTPSQESSRSGSLTKSRPWQVMVQWEAHRDTVRLEKSTREKLPLQRLPIFFQAFFWIKGALKARASALWTRVAMRKFKSDIFLLVNLRVMEI